MSEGILNSLEPKIVWSIFEEITKIPRPSKKEQKIRAWIKDWIKKNTTIVLKEDEVGNILLRKEASSGCEAYPTLILQAHMDMVCQKQPNIIMDFDNNPLSIYIDEEHIKAKGTTLGADNGIGMACGLAALISPDLKHGPIEVLLTVDEETGFTGAIGISKGFFSGKYLLNIDSEEVGKITISSAGGGGTDIILPISYAEKKSFQGITLQVTGLLGGHSGVDIDLPRLNAIKVGIDALMGIQDMILISKITAGSAHNAIPRDFECEILVATEKSKTVLKHLNNWKKKTLSIAKISEPKIKIIIEKSYGQKAICFDKSKALLAILYEINHGVISYSKQMKDLVQTSNNLAVIDTLENQIKIHVSTRSSERKELELARNEIKEIGEKNSAEVILHEAYPGWMPNLDLPFVNMIKKIYEEVIKQPVRLEAIHAGLECGLFVALDPELQVSSIGPNIYNAHSPDECVEIKSVEIIWEVITRIVENMGSL